ncbi:MAG: hypothetical protein FWD67_09880 [Betaproteobacteria bacterium]|nr:hypothetical protein [Betaproteobacteria bacterium]
MDNEYNEAVEFVKAMVQFAQSLNPSYPFESDHDKPKKTGDMYTFNITALDALKVKYKDMAGFDMERLDKNEFETLRMLANDYISRDKEMPELIKSFVIYIVENSNLKKPQGRQKQLIRDDRIIYLARLVKDKFPQLPLYSEETETVARAISQGIENKISVEAVTRILKLKYDNSRG